MCTNSARLVNSLECYMDDLVETFEDFVKKSLFIISVAVGALIVMLGYVLKIINERTEGLQGNPYGSPRPETIISSAQSFQSPQSLQSPQSSMGIQSLQGSRSSTHEKCSSVAMPCFKKECKRTSSAGANTGPLSSIPSFDKKVLRNIGLSSCSKSCMQSKRSIMRNSSTPRVAIPSIPTCIPKRKPE